MEAEGWYVDPFGAHGERWFSGGHPTSLVRDGEDESQDEPPSDEWDGPLARLEADDEESVDGPDAPGVADTLFDAGFRVGLNPLDGQF
jgi:hypothetical protein